MDRPSARIVVLASGEGSTFAALAEACRAGTLPAEIVTLVVSRDGVGASKLAGQLRIPILVFSPREFSSSSQWDVNLAQALKVINPDLIVLAGFMLKLGPEMIKAFPRKIINTHPSLLPKYGGKGMYGRNIHEAVLAAGEPETGVTVHYVTEDYDSGPVISQERLKVLPEDTVESLERRVKEAEKNHLVSALAGLLPT